MEKTDMDREAEGFLSAIDWDHRLWPRASAYSDEEGEWTLTVLGTGEDFVKVHRLLLDEGFVVEDSTESYKRRADA